MKVFLSGLKALLVTLVFALVIEPAAAAPRFPESPAFRILTVKDGLPSTSVTQIAEDRQGYLWIGTTDGLARYDGVEFRVWRFDPQREDSLLGYTVVALASCSGSRMALTA